MGFIHAVGLALAFSATVAGSEAPPPSEAVPTQERNAVEDAVRAYVQAFYELDPDRIRRHVDPVVANRGFVPASEAGGFRQVSLSFDDIVESAATTNRDGVFPDDPVLEVTVFEVLDRVASAKVVAAWGTDYMHLAKIEGELKIVHVLWQTRPR